MTSWFLELTWDRSETITTSEYFTHGHHYGIDLTKGFFYTDFHGLTLTSYSRDGINYMINRRYGYCFCKYALFARFIALINTISFLLISPISFIIYLTILVGSFIGFFIFLLLCPIGLCFNSYKIKIKMSIFICIVGFIGSFLALLSIIAYLLLCPLHILIPEFTIKVLKMHLWGKQLDYCD